MFESFDKETKLELKNKTYLGKRIMIYKSFIQSIRVLPKDTIFKTTTHETIVKRMKENKNIVIIKNKRNIFVHFLIIEKLKLGIYKDLFKPVKFYNISFKIIK